MFSTLFLATVIASASPAAAPAAPTVKVEILEGVPDKLKWDLSKAKVTETYTEPAFGLVTLPTRYSTKAHALDRKTPFIVRASARIQLPAGKYRLLLRSREAARLFVDDKLFLQHPFLRVRQDAHNPVKPAPPPVAKGIPPLTAGQRDKLKMLRLDGKAHTFRLEVIVGTRKTRPELGNPAVAIAGENGPFSLLGAQGSVKFDSAGWQQYITAARHRHKLRDTETRKRVSVAEVAYWNKRHDIARKVVKDYAVPTPPKVSNKQAVKNAVDLYINALLEEKNVPPNSLSSDIVFLRRVTLDTTGVIPSRQEILRFMKDKRKDKRARLIERLLNDPRWADHWVSYWQDVLAENPSLIKPTLNNTGPFRLWLYQAFSDNLPMDRFATDLIMMEGSSYHGAPAAFGLATKNDAPMAAKAHVLAGAFMAADLSCARCHDAPYHPYKQKQLFGMAAMLKRGVLKVPSTSTVKFVPGGRKPGVAVTLPAGSKVQPAWHFAKLTPTEIPDGILRNAKDSREKLAAIMTSPKNRRFAKVIVNRIWQRYMGVGLVSDVDDWHRAKISHPELLDWLAQELITHDYDVKHIARLILNSHTYQRMTQDKDQLTKRRLFAGPAKRRMTAEQLLDSLFVAVGKKFDCEELTFDPECWQRKQNCINLGKPRRAWQFIDLSNERDRPALALPYAQGYVDLLTAFGWRPSRPSPRSLRDDSLTPVQIMTLANGQLMNRLVKLTDDGEITELCLKEKELPQLVRKVYEHILSRSPTAEEARMAIELLHEGFDSRRTGMPPAKKVSPPRAASWSHHLHPEATNMQLRAERAARTGATPTPRLQAAWRERMEDFVWSLLNSPEFIFVP